MVNPPAESRLADSAPLFLHSVERVYQKDIDRVVTAATSSVAVALRFSLAFAFPLLFTHHQPHFCVDEFWGQGKTIRLRQRSKAFNDLIAQLIVLSGPAQLLLSFRSCERIQLSYQNMWHASVPSLPWIDQGFTSLIRMVGIITPPNDRGPSLE